MPKHYSENGGLMSDQKYRKTMGGGHTLAKDQDAVKGSSYKGSTYKTMHRKPKMAMKGKSYK